MDSRTFEQQLYNCYVTHTLQMDFTHNLCVPHHGLLCQVNAYSSNLSNVCDPNEAEVTLFPFSPQNKECAVMCVCR